MAEIIALLAILLVAAFLMSRLPDTRKWLSEDIDDAFYKGGVRALWFIVAIATVAFLALLLL